jgi:hypothetical protein
MAVRDEMEKCTPVRQLTRHGLPLAKYFREERDLALVHQKCLPASRRPEFHAWCRAKLIIRAIPLLHFCSGLFIAIVSGRKNLFHGSHHIINIGRG